MDELQIITILDYLQTSGDIAIWVFVYLAWRFDKRLHALEMKIDIMNEGKTNG
tara:strand:+ start:708 stop:866 length:159 start_codon:yes stop_codon:yes gene_type:complete